MTASGSAVRVFVSYTQEDAAHTNRVTQLVEDLRVYGGVDARFDRHVLHTPPEGWARWMENEIASATYVLVVCTETYLRRYTQQEKPGKGKGAIWESLIIRDEMYDNAGNNVKFAAVLFDESDAAHKPPPLKSHTHYLYPDPKGRERLLRWLTSQPEYIAPPIGKVPRLPPNP